MILSCQMWNEMSHNRIFPTMWYVQQANAQISLRTFPVCSEPLLVT